MKKIILIFIFVTVFGVYSPVIASGPTDSQEEENIEEMIGDIQDRRAVLSAQAERINDDSVNIFYIVLGVMIAPLILFTLRKLVLKSTLKN